MTTRQKLKWLSESFFMTPRLFRVDRIHNQQSIMDEYPGTEDRTETTDIEHATVIDGSLSLIERRARNSVNAYLSVNRKEYGPTSPDDLVILFSQVTDTHYWALLRHPNGTAVWAFRLDLGADYWTIEHFSYVDQIDSRKGWEE